MPALQYRLTHGADLKAYELISHAKFSQGQFTRFYTNRWSQQAFADKTLGMIYFASFAQKKLAA